MARLDQEDLNILILFLLLSLPPSPLPPLIQAPFPAAYTKHWQPELDPSPVLYPFARLHVQVLNGGSTPGVEPGVHISRVLCMLGWGEISNNIKNEQNG